MANQGMPKKRKSFPDREAVIERLRKRDGENCWLCKTEILFWPERHPDLGSVTIDHVLPVSHGGDNEDENLKLAHYICNNVRGDSVNPVEIKSRIETLFINGNPATAKQRRFMLIEEMAKKPKEPIYPFCAWPRVKAFVHIDEHGNIMRTYEPVVHPNYLH